MSLKLFVLALVISAAVAQGQTFENEYDEAVEFKCPKHEVITSVYSVHSTVQLDRRWSFGCGKTPGDVDPNFCNWTDDYVNDWDQPVMFMCPANYMIQGVASIHNNVKEDRRMKVRCCRRSGVKTRSCSVTDYLNDWGAPLNYTVSRGKVLVGWFSYHDDATEDRRHKMIECGLL